MDSSTSDSSLLHYLPAFAQVLPGKSHGERSLAGYSPWVAKSQTILSDLASNHLILCHFFAFCPQSFPESGSFAMSQLFISGGQSIGASASASFLPMNILGSFPLGLTGLISLQSKGLSPSSPEVLLVMRMYFP